MPSMTQKDFQPLQDALDKYDREHALGLCPKCGSEMVANYPTDSTHYRYDCPNLHCGHWTVVKDVRGHEEKVKP